MDVLELKFLLTLLSFPGYRAPLSHLQFAPRTRAAVRLQICRTLCNRGFVACSETMVRLKLAPPGNALLKLNHDQLPITLQERQVLQAAAKQTITPGKTGLSPAERSTIIQGLADRGLLHVETRIQDVWLTDAGKLFLNDVYEPKGRATISLDLLKNYLQLVRRSTALSPGNGAQPSLAISSTVPSNDTQLLQLIRSLDREQGTQNYLPLFYLRQRLQPPMSRDEVDQALYRLQRQDLIELSSLQEAIVYTPRQIDAGIPQDIGGPLFFISVVEGADIGA